jgi:hypothetical protein
MKFLHWEVEAAEGTVVRVELDAQANVMLMDGSNFSAYRPCRMPLPEERAAGSRPLHVVMPDSSHDEGVVRETALRRVPPRRGRAHA